MAWTSKKTVNLRDTVAFATDNANEICLPADPLVGGDNPLYTPGTHSRSPLTLHTDSFNIGWNATGLDGARDRSANVPSAGDHRLAGKQGYNSGSSTLTVQLGTAAGQYRFWAAFCDQTNGTAGTLSWVLADAGGTITSQTGKTALTANQVYDINGNLYTDGAGWAAAADGSGVGFTFTTSDTSNGNGGPLITLQCSNANTPLSSVSFQYLGAVGGSSSGPLLLLGAG
jgi:hypothetical protein